MIIIFKLVIGRKGFEWMDGDESPQEGSQLLRENLEEQSMRKEMNPTVKPWPALPPSL